MPFKILNNGIQILKRQFVTVLFDLFIFASYTLVKIFNAMKQSDLAFGL